MISINGYGGWEYGYGYGDEYERGCGIGNGYEGDGNGCGKGYNGEAFAQVLPISHAVSHKPEKEL